MVEQGSDHSTSASGRAAESEVSVIQGTLRASTEDRMGTQLRKKREKKNKKDL